MHKIYKDRGKYNFIYQIPQIIYSTAISSLINIIIQLLALSEKDVLELKKEKKINELKTKKAKLFSVLKIKFILFFILAFILLFFFWYYNTCFCGVYINTKIHLIKDTVISFSLSLLYPFGIYLLPGLLRIPSLKSKKRQYIYNASKILQIL